MHTHTHTIAALGAMKIAYQKYGKAEGKRERGGWGPT